MVYQILKTILPNNIIWPQWHNGGPSVPTNILKSKVGWSVHSYAFKIKWSIPRTVRLSIALPKILVTARL